MNYETILYTSIHFYKESFNHKWEVEDKLKYAQEINRQAKNTLRDLGIKVI